MKDYTGVSTRQLGDVYAKYTDVDDIEIFASRIGRDVRDLKRVLVTQNYQFVGLDYADNICLGMGLTIGSLTRSGELTVVPARGNTAAKQMAQDEWQTENEDEDGNCEPPTQEWIDQRAEELIKLRGFVLGPMTETQIAQAASERERRLKK